MKTCEGLNMFQQQNTYTLSVSMAVYIIISDWWMAKRYLYKAKYRICLLVINAISTTRLAI